MGKKDMCTSQIQWLIFAVIQWSGDFSARFFFWTRREDLDRDSSRMIPTYHGFSVMGYPLVMTNIAIENGH
jgi:hypothetical protein